MKPEQAKELRKPFPASTIGKLPKPMYRDSKKDNCRECGGYHGLPAVHLDYVGHAAVTDRLLSVDPDWSWEPLALDEQGLPALDRKGNLWIRLTIGGITRIGVGDGGSAKECIGDAIRNAAMRFGVALDLWSKEELEQAHGPAAQPQTSAPGASGPASSADVEPDPGAEPAPPLEEGPSDPREDGVLLNTSSRLAKAMYASINNFGLTDAERLPFIVRVIGREIESTKQMTETEARRVLKHLDELNNIGKDGAA